MGKLVATTKTFIARDNFGRFIGQLDKAATDTVQDMVVDGAKLSRKLAPKGKKRDPRYPTTLSKSVVPAMLDGRTGVWGSDLPYALVRERGGGGWLITGNLNFFWEKKGRWWHTPRGMASTVRHPATKGTRYLQNSYDIIMLRWMQYARRNYPG